jgi:uncharacterized membrane protein YbhN (UPF0104 family)
VSPAGARALRYAPVLVSALALAGVAGWASRQQVPALPEGVGFRLLAAGVALYALATLVRCERWHRLLVLTGVPSARADAYGLVTVGYMANNALVARAGDVLKAVLTAGRTGAGGARVAGLAVGERGLDVLALLVLFAAAGLLGRGAGLPGTGAVLRDGAIAAAVAVVLMLATAALLARRTRIVSGAWRQLVVAALALRPLAGRGGIGLLAMSTLLWLLEAGVYLAVAGAVDVHLDLLACVQIVALVNLVGLIPAAPASLGTFDAAVLFATRQLTSGGGLAYVLVLRLVLFVPITLVGFVVLVTRHGGLGRLRTRHPLSSEA